MTSNSINEIATLRIELTGSNPLIWRQVEVPTSVTLKVLHKIVQAAMGWFDEHLWELKIGDRRYVLPVDGEWRDTPTTDAGKVRLRQVLQPGQTVIDYLYDFGDDWHHRLVVKNIRAGDPEIGYPLYVGGENAVPPEDCGGLGGFYDLVAILADSDHPEHDEISDQLGDFDPTVVNEDAIRVALGRIAGARRAMQVRMRKKAKGDA
ncbi:plasmid pRiA4b ORF-3 family protein [Emcibacter sp. SYSU 3D8]|uniref:plasmid pRiA4b ORF-3 family protein n=1 Tax=Emcibacter sp. SYSU 3D8 TaxID=3133969 RepID=UPI0031FED443